MMFEAALRDVWWRMRVVICLSFVRVSTRRVEQQARVAALCCPGHWVFFCGTYPMSSNVSPSPRMSPPRAICSLFLFRLFSCSRAHVSVLPTLPFSAVSESVVCTL